MSRKFIKHGNSTLKLSAITWVSWGRQYSNWHCGGYRSGYKETFSAKVTVRTGEDKSVECYDSDELAEQAHDAIVSRWKDA